ISDAAEYRLEDAGDRYRLVLDVAPAARLEHESVDAIMSLAVRTIRALYSDRTVGPVRVALPRPPPPATEAHGKFFPAPPSVAARAHRGGAQPRAGRGAAAEWPGGAGASQRRGHVARPAADRSADPGATRPRHRPRSSRRRRADAGERGAHARRGSAHPAAPA